VGAYYNEFRERLKQGEDAEEILNKMGIHRYCCRRMLMSHVDLIQNIARFKKA